MSSTVFNMGGGSNKKHNICGYAWCQTTSATMFKVGSNLSSSGYRLRNVDNDYFSFDPVTNIGNIDNVNFGFKCLKPGNYKLVYFGTNGRDSSGTRSTIRFQVMIKKATSSVAQVMQLDNANRFRDITGAGGSDIISLSSGIVLYESTSVTAQSTFDVGDIVYCQVRNEPADDSNLPILSFGYAIITEELVPESD